MVRWCPRCWHENPYTAQRKCGADLRGAEPGDRVDHLITALHHPLGTTRKLMAVLLGKTRDPRALTALEEAAHQAVAERDWALLDGVIEGLAAYGSREAAGILAFIAEKGYAGARHAATEALAALETQAD